MTRGPDPSSLMSRIVAACAQPEGASMREIRERTAGSSESISSMTPHLVDVGRLHRCGTRMLYRYFADAQARDAWMADKAQPHMEAELQRQREVRNARRRKGKAEYSKRRYAEKQAKLGLTVKPRAERKAQGSPDIPTTPKKAKRGQPGCGRAIIIGVPKRPLPERKFQEHAEPIITPETKITVCPSYVDRRFAADPSIAGRGAISQDYFERRQQEQGQ